MVLGSRKLFRSVVCFCGFGAGEGSYFSGSDSGVGELVFLLCLWAVVVSLLLACRVAVA
jgi:hypothetical protein